MDIQGIIEKKKDKIIALQNAYNDSLENFVVGELDFKIVHRNAIAFFNYIEDCCASSKSSLELKNSGWNQWLAETCLDVLPLIEQHYILYRDIRKNPELAPSGRAYAGMQRLACEIDTNAAKVCEEAFSRSGLPIFGFKNKDKLKMKGGIDKYLGFSFGTIFIIVILLTAIFFPTPTPYQYTIFRVVLSLAAGGVGAVLPGMIEVKYKNIVRASGAAAFFVIVYMINPVALIAI